MEVLQTQKDEGRKDTEASLRLKAPPLKIFGNGQGGKSNFEVEKLGRHHLNLVLNVNNPRKGKK